MVSQRPTSVDTSTLNSVQYNIDGLSQLFLICFGMMANTTTVGFLMRAPKIKPCVRVFLTCLAISDMVVLLCSLLLISLPQLISTYTVTWYPYAAVYVYPVGMIARTCATCFIVAFSICRATAVRNPLRTVASYSKSSINLSVVIIILVSVASNSCRWFEYEIVHGTDEANETAAVKFGLTAFGSNESYNQVYHIYGYSLTMLICPLLAMAVFNTLLIRSVKQAKKRRTLMASKQPSKQDTRMTIMLMSIMTVFIVCQVPAVIYKIQFSLNAEIKDSLGWEILSSVRDLLITFQSAVNFVLYILCGGQFRTYIINVFRCRKSK